MRHALRLLIAVLTAACTRAARPVVASDEPAQSLLVSGVIQDNFLSLSPAYFVDTRPGSTADTGAFHVQALDTAGHVLAERSFGVLRPEGSARTAHFAVALPVTSATRAELASLRVSGPGMSAASRASRAGRQAVLTDIARAGDSTKVLRVSGGIVRVAYDAARWAGVMICDPDTHEVLAFGATGEALVSTNKQSLRLVFSDGVQSAAITLPVKESRP